MELFHLLKNMFYFPFLVLRESITTGLFFFTGGLSKWKNWDRVPTPGIQGKWDTKRDARSKSSMGP